MEEKNSLTFEQFYKEFNIYFPDLNQRHYNFIWNLIKTQPDYIDVNSPTKYLPADINDTKNDIYKFFKKINFNKIYFEKIMLITSSRIMMNSDIVWLKQKEEEVILFILEKFIENGLMIDDINLPFNYQEKYGFLIRNNTYRPSLIKALKYPMLLSSSDNIYNYAINFIDYINADQNKKRNMMTSFFNSWTQKNNNIKKNINWIKTDFCSQQEWVLQYLSKKNISLNFNIFPTISNYQKIHVLLHKVHFENSLNEKIFYDSMKKSWSQKKFRDSGKTKKPYHLPLTKESIRKLDKLSQYLNKSNNHVIEELIDKNFSDLILDEKGKEKY